MALLLLLAGVSVLAPSLTNQPVFAPPAPAGVKRPAYEAATLWCLEAQRTARLRRAGHAANGSPRHWGQSEDLTDEYYGSLGSIVFHQHSLARGVTMELAPLYLPNDQLQNLPQWDARVGAVTIEIKAIPPDTRREDGSLVHRTRLLVKKAENHYSDYYVAVRFESPTRYWFAGYAALAEVLAAPIFDKFAPAHALPLSQLHDLSGATWLRSS